MPAPPLYEIVDPDGVRSSTLAPAPLMALRLFHAEAFGSDRHVRLIDGQLVFKRRADQELVAGEWHVVQQSVNGAGAGISTVVTIPPPAETPADRGAGYESRSPRSSRRNRPGL